MSQSNETKKPAGRPSLLSAEQQVALEQHPVVPQAGPAAAAPAPAAARRKPLRLAAVIAVLAGLAALAATQFASDPDPEPVLAAAPAAAAQAPAAAAAPAAADVAGSVAGTLAAADGAAPNGEAASPAAATPAVLAAALDAPPADAGAAKTATIIDEVPPPAGAKPKETLAQMLEGGAAPATKAGAPKVVKKPVAASKPAKPAAKSQTSTPAEPDNDVALLAALVAHAKYDTSANARLSLPKALQQCKKQGKQDAARCRIRVCEGRWKKDECRVYSRSKLEKAATGA